MDRECSRTKTTQSTLLAGSHVISGAAHSGLRGWRLSMEGAVVTELLSAELGVFAVLDGHGGRYCSQWAADELPQRLRHVAAAAEGSEDVDAEAWQVAQQLSEAVRQMDLDLRGCGRAAWACGTTLVTLLVTRRSLTVANVGDSRAVLCRAGVALPLSRDHKPKVSAERQRILHAGGFIVDGRVHGDLSLSRALGDFRHKMVAHLPPSKRARRARHSHTNRRSARALAAPRSLHRARAALGSDACRCRRAWTVRARPSARTALIPPRRRRQSP